MQVEPSYEYSALPTDDYDNQLPMEKFSPQQIFSNTINFNNKSFEKWKYRNINK